MIPFSAKKTVLTRFANPHDAGRMAQFSQNNTGAAARVLKSALYSA
jgi:hypothetical protein